VSSCLHYLQDRLESSEIAHLERETQLIVNGLTSYERALEKHAALIGSVFAAEFDPQFTIDNNATERAGDVDAPLLRNHERVLNNDFAVSDRLLTNTGAVSSVFVRKGDEFVRISTSLKNEKGGRVLGTILPPKEATASRLLADQTWSGRVLLFGREWMAHYQPVKDASGKIVGCLAIAMDFSTGYAAVKEQIKKLTIGETGYVFVVDAKPGTSQGSVIIHPQSEGKNVLDTVSADGQTIFREMIEKKEGILRYTWRNDGEANPRGKLTVYRYFEPWQWVIGSGSYRDEFMRLADTLTLWTIFGALLIATALSAILFLLVRGLVGQPLRQLRTAMAGLTAGGGDLTVRMPVIARDEVGRLAQTFNAFLDWLQEMVRRTAHTANAVSDATQGLAQATASVTKTSATQSEAADAGAAAVEEMAASIASVADSAKDVHAQALTSRDQTRRGNSELQSVLGELAAVGDAVNSIAGTVHQFVGDVASITGLTRRMQEIAEQTNLLALNAAIEAARAGESGRGFAVVADEVRKLAEKSTRSAREIDAVTAALDAQSGKVDEAIRVGQEALANGLGNLLQVATLLEQAGDTVDAASGGISVISESVREQTAVSAEIASQIATIARMSEDSLHALRQAEQNVQTLETLSSTLSEHVGHFKT
jgi:methyl-accepting chemotaxis protein-2 (aspartate sensor receptor)